jgi:hypothetical protein
MGEETQTMGGGECHPVRFRLPAGTSHCSAHIASAAPELSGVETRRQDGLTQGLWSPS